MNESPYMNQYLRARLDVFRDTIAKTANEDQDLALLRNGVMRDKEQEKELVGTQLENKYYSNKDLTLLELCSFNNWFDLHPEKICGKEIITSSREFPLSIQGDRYLIEKTINEGIGDEFINPNDPSNTLELEALALELELQMITL